MIKRYVDDMNTLLRALKPGVRFDAMEEKLVLVEEMIELDMSQLLLLGKFEYTGGPIFKVVLEC